MELSIRCHDLAHFDRICNSFVVFYSEEPGALSGSSTYKDQGKTELVRGDQNPVYITAFNVTYSFEKQQRYRFDVYLADAKADTKFLTRHMLLGSAHFNIHELVCSPTKTLTRDIKSPKQSGNGSLTVIAEEVSKLNHKVKMNWKLEKCKVKGRVMLRVCRTLGKELVPIFQSNSMEPRPCCKT